MRTYTTQMDAARQGIITPETKRVAAKEYRTPEEIRDLVARGQAVICANRLHRCLDPNGVGAALRTKINVNLGVSRDCRDYDAEMEKVMAAVRNSRAPEQEDSCSMCGKFCAVRSMNKALAGEYIDIL